MGFNEYMFDVNTQVSREGVVSWTASAPAGMHAAGMFTLLAASTAVHGAGCTQHLPMYDITVLYIHCKRDPRAMTLLQLAR